MKRICDPCMIIINHNSRRLDSLVYLDFSQKGHKVQLDSAAQHAL